MRSRVHIFVGRTKKYLEHTFPVIRRVNINTGFYMEFILKYIMRAKGVARKLQQPGNRSSSGKL